MWGKIAWAMIVLIISGFILADAYDTERHDAAVHDSTVEWSR